LRATTSEETFKEIWKKVEESGAGEPGIFWTNDLECGCNPCNEIGLLPHQFCNLTEINASDCETQEELNSRSTAAAFIGTLQASYTDLHYLRSIWKETTEREALIGVSQTGVASNKVTKLNLIEAAECVKTENSRVAKLIGINEAARTTCLKPAGSTSLRLGTASGIHGWHAEYYMRRMRIGKGEALYGYMIKHIPELMEDCHFKPHLESVAAFPQKAPEGSILRTESFMSLLKRVAKFNTEWVRAGHRSGINTNNVSCTISLKPNEWSKCGQWMWENREIYNGISVLPYDGGSYIQAPFEDITEEKYNEMMKFLKNVDLSKIIEETDETILIQEAACAGGSCEI
jgi:ribonucleoside-diphosphate reductase alpha chain